MPVTRRESRASHTGADTGVHLEQILDNFEQCASRADPVRRKHIAQNRDIVRANTLAQLRIRELESRVLALEQERAEHVLAEGKQKAQLRRLEYALECVRVGWETMAQGLQDAGVDAHTGDIEVPRSTSVRVSLGDTHTTRIPVARAVQPMDGIGEEDEEDEAAAALPMRTSASDHVALPLQGDVCPASVTRRRVSRRRSRASDEHKALVQETPAQAPQDTGADLATGIDAPLEAALNAAVDAEMDAALAETAPLPASPLAPLAADTPAPLLPSSPTTSSPRAEPAAAPRSPPPADAPNSPVAEAAAEPTYPPPPRKRGRTSRVATPELSDELAVPLGTRRARKSVNYALPKLNTKMRKPDTEPDDSRRARSRSADKEPPKAVKGEAPAAEELAQPTPASASAPNHEAAEAPQAAEVVAASRDAHEAPTASTAPRAAPRTTPSKRGRRSDAPHALLRTTAPLPARNATPHTKRQLPPSARLERLRSAPAPPFGACDQSAVSVLQEHSAQNLPTWASSLMNLASPEPPAPRKSLGTASGAPPSPSAARGVARRARRAGQENVPVP
ncbi:hypothetical protein MBRA1_003098 [Malassezia brasiliensis]|uniref:Shugoshin C-terminal domain-containing protein n=1 Tax=Malassezia brasiliensis TaxID=1821822 RepID=A0AAF0DVC0_9BASI|nr:hypothetical protein MBRA1_003098 [Malassezia brasiliensis]